MEDPERDEVHDAGACERAAAALSAPAHSERGGARARAAAAARAPREHTAMVSGKSRTLQVSLLYTLYPMLNA